MKRNLFEVSLTSICIILFVFIKFNEMPLITTILSVYAIYLMSALVMYMVSSEGANQFTELVINKQEKSRIRLWLIVCLNIALLSVSITPYALSHWIKLKTGPFFTFNNNLGWTAIVVFGFCFILLPFMSTLTFSTKIDKLIKQLKKDNVISPDFKHVWMWEPIKRISGGLMKSIRKWHVPIAIIGILFSLYHMYLALEGGFKWNYTYISGYVAITDLLVLSLLGMLRFKKLDRNLHKYLSYVFIIFLTLHFVFCELRL